MRVPVGCTRHADVLVLLQCAEAERRVRSVVVELLRAVHLSLAKAGADDAVVRAACALRLGALLSDALDHREAVQVLNRANRRRQSVDKVLIIRADAQVAIRLVDVADDERWAWLMPHRVAVWIYWHAAILVLRKGLTFFGHPRSAAGEAAAPFKEGVLERAAQMGFSAPPRAAAGMCPFVWRDAADYPWEA